MNDDEFDRLLRERHRSFVRELSVHAPAPPRRVPRRERLTVLVAALAARVAPRVVVWSRRPVLAGVCLIVAVVVVAVSGVDVMARGPITGTRVAMPTSGGPAPTDLRTAPAGTPTAGQSVQSQDGSPRIETALGTIEFAPDSAQLTSDGDLYLRRHVVVYQRYRDVEFRLYGRTASIGPADSALRLSSDRTIVVRDWLVDNGVRPDRIRSEAFGYSRPLVPDRDGNGGLILDAAQRNRSVEVVVSWL